MPRSPRRTSIGSPGTRRIIMNVTNISATKVGTVSANRRKRKRIMAFGYSEAGRFGRPASGPLFGNVDAVELVASQGADLVARHLLAHRLEHGRVRDRHDRRLFLGNDLHLLIELGAVGLLRQLLGLLKPVFERFVAPLGDVLAAFTRTRATQKEEEIVRIAVIAGP